MIPKAFVSFRPAHSASRSECDKCGKSGFLPVREELGDGEELERSRISNGSGMKCSGISNSVFEQSKSDEVYTDDSESEFLSRSGLVSEWIHKRGNVSGMKYSARWLSEQDSSSRGMSSSEV